MYMYMYLYMYMYRHMYIVVDFIILLGESQQAVPFYWEPQVMFYEYNEYRGGAGLAAFRWKGIPSVRFQKRNRV